MIAKLIPSDGSPSITINRDLTLVGRKKGLCDLVLSHTSVSKVHCAIAKTDGLLFIRDLGSTNGTKVNGQRVTRGALLPGDELAFATEKFIIHLGPGEPPLSATDRTEKLTRFPVLIDKQKSADDQEPEFIGMSSDSDVKMNPEDSF